MRIPFFAVVILAGFFACDIGSFPAATPLHPPLGLVVDSVNPGEIYIEFWAFNDEDAFAGYNIYMAQTSNLAAGRGTNECLTNKNGDFPSLGSADGVLRSSDVEQRKFTLRKGPRAAPLASNSVWYITVSSYDWYTKTDSRLGEIKPVTVK